MSGWKCVRVCLFMVFCSHCVLFQFYQLFKRLNEEWYPHAKFRPPVVMFFSLAAGCTIGAFTLFIHNSCALYCPF